MSVIDFEGGIPQCLKVEGGTVFVTAEQAKQGCSSLQWCFSYGDRIAFDTDIGYHLHREAGDNRLYTFGMYVWDNGSTGKLRVTFEKNGEEKTGFDICLGFFGWRSVMACFERDMYGTPEESMNRLVVTATGEGTILLDEIVTANKMDSRFIRKSYQLPHIETYYSPIVKFRKMKEAYRDAPVFLRDVCLIRERIRDYVMTEFVNGKSQSIDELKESVDALCLTDSPMGIRGKRVESFEQRKLLHGFPGANEKYIGIEALCKIMLSLAVCYAETGENDACMMYVKLLRHFISQGFAEGSSFGTHFLLDYALRPFYVSMFLMKDVIQEAGLLEIVLSASHWFLNVDSMGFIEDVIENKPTTDDLLNCAQGVLFYILLIEDEKKQASYLSAFSHWLDKNMMFSNGLEGLFKEDGCIYHHHGHYIAYGQGGLNGIAPIIYAICNTNYDVSEAAWKNMRKVMESLHFQCNGRKVPIAFSGRHPLGNQRLYLEMFKYFALSAQEKGDLKFVGLYLDLIDEPTDFMDKKLYKSSATKELILNENRSYPMACASVHRRGRHIAVAKGFSRYLWGSEIYLTNNLYGRYRSYGVLELMSETETFSHDGYDWNRFPGATAVNLPFEKLKANVVQVDRQCGFEEMLISDQGYAGGLECGENGMFSMKLSGHSKYNSSFFARKSIFFYKDFILLLGTDICDESGYAVETTLFQNSIINNDLLPEFNGESISNGFLEVKRGDVIKDTAGFEYHFYKKEKILLQTGEQISQDSTGKGETNGNFSTAVICHGNNPQKADYAYGICLNKSEEPYCEILRQDDFVHMVKFSGITYISIFEPGKYNEIESNLPVMLMIEEKEKNIKIAVCNPDLGLYEKDIDQYDKTGLQKEVGIYSRPWKQNSVASSHLEIKIKKYNFVLSANLKNGRTHYFEMRRGKG